MLPTSGGKAEEFRAAYRKKFGKDPGVLAANGFDAATVAGEALRACGGEEPCARDRLYALKEYPGVSGVFSITPDGGTIKSFGRRIVSGGAFVPAP